MTKKRRKRHTRTPLQRRARKGFRGYPVATVAYYGPDDQFASKVAVGIMLREEDKDIAFLERWFAQDQDVRLDPKINQEIVAFIRQHQVKSVAMADRIIGCPHEEGIDYPEGESCPQCPFWAGRDRWAGELVGREVRGEPGGGMVTGCAWYRADQWDRLCEISADRDKLEETHAEWVASAEETLRGMRNMGVRVEKVEVDVEELLAWCQAHHLEVDGGARAKYAAEMLRQRGVGHARGGDGV